MTISNHRWSRSRASQGNELARQKFGNALGSVDSGRGSGVNFSTSCSSLPLLPVGLGSVEP
eukprot:2821580-Pyramimonas_sp.AAC.1